MAGGLKKRHRDILNALKELGGMATVRQIAEKVGLHVNGVSQSLRVLTKYAVLVSGKGREAVYWFLTQR